MDKVLREQKRALAPLGYEYMGQRHSAGGGKGAGRGHYVFRHPNGDVLVTPSTPRNPGRSLAMTLARAKRADKARESVAEQWRQFLRDEFGVGESDEKLVEFEVGKLREKFRRQHPDATVSDSLFTVAITDNDLFELVERGRGWGQNGASTPSKYLIRGPLAGLARDDDDVDNELVPTQPEEMCGASLQLRTGGYAVCTEPREHEGDHHDQYRKVDWSADTETEDAGVLAAAGEHDREPVPAADDVGGTTGEPVEPQPVAEGAGSERAAPAGEQAAAIREPVVAATAPTAGGFTIGEGLAAQLVDALAGDLRAENDLLRETIGTAAAQLSAIGRELAAALDLGSAQKPASNRIGRQGLRYLRAMRAATLPAQFTVDDAVAAAVAAGITAPSKGSKGDLRQSVASALTLFARAGYLRRSARGVYEWAE